MRSLNHVFLRAQHLACALAVVAMPLAAGPTLAQSGEIVDLATVEEHGAKAQIALLGEVHDNPVHHLSQAHLVQALAPRAVVWEMLTEDQAARLTPERLAQTDSLSALLDWDQSGWPEFSLYQPIFAAATNARHYGAAVPRADARAAMEQGAAVFFGADAARFGLDQPLSEQDQLMREGEQMAAHCDALPETLLPAMVAIQRLRDATLARSALLALEQTGGPVVVITGNGHVRRDQGVPSILAVAAPEIAVFALGQAEEGQIAGTFDFLLDARVVERPDPCAAFK